MAAFPNAGAKEHEYLIHYVYHLS